MDKGVVNIRGKEYQTVAKRISDFRAEHPLWAVTTDIQSNADTILIRAIISDEQSRVIASGYAEEVRDSTNINKTSAVENCETSAVGRALAFLGYGGEQIASANEVNDAIIAGAKKEVVDYMVSFASVLRTHIASVSCIQHSIHGDELGTASEAWHEIPEEDQRVLWLSTSKGGIFTTKEREIIKSSEFRKAHYGDDNE